jgi:hypothetical protein
MVKITLFNLPKFHKYRVGFKSDSSQFTMFMWANKVNKRARDEYMFPKESNMKFNEIPKEDKRVIVADLFEMEWYLGANK